MINVDDENLVNNNIDGGGEKLNNEVFYNKKTTENTESINLEDKKSREFNNDTEDDTEDYTVNNKEDNIEDDKEDDTEDDKVDDKIDDIEENIDDDTEILNNFPVEENKNPLLEGGNDIKYDIDYILPDDEKLINIEKVNKKVDKYIENYNSPEMIKYNQAFKQLYQKYSTKKYIIKTIKNKNNATKIIVVKNDSKGESIKEITKPEYLFYNDENNLHKLKLKISNSRYELQYKYETLTAKLNITPDDKKEFESYKNKFIELLEEYYIYTLYHKKINNIINNNKTNLLIQELSVFYNENIEKTKPILNANQYTIDNSLIEMLNNFNINKLNNFNDIMLKLSGKDKNIKDDIKKYLDKKEINSINENIKKNILQQTEDNLIDYIILSLPSGL